MERSCMCCQESGEREASVSLFCPKAKQGDKKFRKVIILNEIHSVTNLMKSPTLSYKDFSYSLKGTYLFKKIVAENKKLLDRCR